MKTYRVVAMKHDKYSSIYKPDCNVIKEFKALEEARNSMKEMDKQKQGVVGQLVIFEIENNNQWIVDIEPK